MHQGPAAEVVPTLAQELDAELVVMGTVGRTGIAGLLIGNTAETILERLASSVLAVKPPGFRTPVMADD
ncbi:MAG: universal stress protein [Halofilum sp. (in: g-proteobacteria)]|nr:universal stress protein [Halofilum sp. (in: g-proteobacteria)]